MDHDSPSTLFARYRKLLAEYRQAAAKCQEDLNKLEAAEAKLRELAQALGESDELPCLAAKYNALLDIAKLSERELEVFAMIGQGCATDEIASILKVAGSTVETYRERIKDKLNIPSGAGLTRHAVIWAWNGGQKADG